MQYPVLSHHLKQLRKACYSTQFLPFYHDLPLDAIGSVCHQFGLLSTDLHLRHIPCAGFGETFNGGLLFLLFLSYSIYLIGKLQIEFAAYMLTFPSCSSRASDMICAIKMLKKVGDRRHPFLTLTVLNLSPMLPFIWAALVALSQSC